MSLSVTPNEANDIADALKAWFVSQDLGPHEAAYVMAHMAGLIVGMDCRDENHMREGLRALHMTMADAASRVLDARRRGCW
jgi:hypothetical protein